MPSSARGADLPSFLRRLPLTLVGAVVIWLVVRPPYTPFLCGASQFVARLFESPRASAVVVQGTDALLGRTDMRPDAQWLKVPLVQVHFNLVPFLALVFALPHPFAKGRWRRFALALVILAASHVLALFLKLELFEAFGMGPWSLAHYSALAKGVIRTASYFFDLPVTFALPLLLWVACYPEQVFPLVGLDPNRER